VRRPRGDGICLTRIGKEANRSPIADQIAVPDEENDREPEVIELVSIKGPPPIVVRRRDRVRRIAIGVAATIIGVMALVLAFRPWRTTGASAHDGPTAHASINATLAKRAKPAPPPPQPPKATVVAAQKKIAAPAKKTQPVATPPKPVAKQPAPAK
jgi:hypothetical protein